MKKAIYTLLIAGVAATSCKKQPDAMFEVDDTTPNTNQTLQFTNNSIDGVTYEWNFGDGTTSEEENPSHVYTMAGTYTVTLTAYSKKEKKSDSQSMSLVVETLFDEKTNEERMIGLWDYDIRETKSYEDGVLVGVETYVAAEDYDIHTLNFLENETVEYRYDDDIETFEWYISNDEEGLFTIDGDEACQIIEISEDNFVYLNAIVEEIDGVTHRDSIFFNLSR